MKYLKFFSLTILSVFLLGFVSCTKEGPEGPQGPAGTPGVDGNANVKTQIITVNPGEWNTSGNSLYVNKDVSIITNDIVSNGAVLVYWKSTGSSYQALPLTWPGTNETIYRFWYDANTIEIQIYQENGPAPTPTSTYTFKVVAIEGNLISKSVPIDLSNYDEVKAYFKLKD